jgi:hypothetical protein
MAVFKLYPKQPEQTRQSLYLIMSCYYYNSDITFLQMFKITRALVIFLVRNSDECHPQQIYNLYKSYHVEKDLENVTGGQIPLKLRNLFRDYINRTRRFVKGKITDYCCIYSVRQEEAEMEVEKIMQELEKKNDINIKVCVKSLVELCDKYTNPRKRKFGQ